jgi:hypothetical protein
MNAYEKIKQHHAKHVYKKGEFKGDAPVSGRGKSHFRVIKYDDAYAVRMYRTDILTIYPNNHIVIDCGGYIERPTTQSNLNEALSLFCGGGISVGKWNMFSYSQPILRTYEKIGDTYSEFKYRYYDGIELSVGRADPEVVSELKLLQRKRINKDKVAAFTTATAQCGFKDAFKVMHAMCEVSNMGDTHPHAALSVQISEVEYSDYWLAIVAKHSFQRFYNRVSGKYVYDKLDAKDVWTALMRECKKHMYEIVDTDVYCVTD